MGSDSVKALPYYLVILGFLALVVGEFTWALSFFIIAFACRER